MRLYEERITVWRASDQDAAIELAEVEADEYTVGSDLKYLGLAQCFELTGPLANGSEVFSLMRDSNLAAESYLNRFFTAGHERQRVWSDPSDRRSTAHGPLV